MARSLVDHGRLSGFFITMLLWSFAHPTVTEGQDDCSMLTAVSITANGSPTAGETYILTCSAACLSTISQSIQWFGPSGSQITTGVSNSNKGSMTTSTLTFSSLRFSDAGQYTCQADQYREATVDVIVEIPSPSVRVTQDAADDTIYAGSVLTLTCTSLVPPSLTDLLEDLTVTATWIGPGGDEVVDTSRSTVSPPVLHMAPTGNLSYTSTVVYDTLRTSDSGPYTCSVTLSSSTPQALVTDGEGVDVVTITVADPAIVVSVVPNVIRFPAMSPYNTFTILCTATTPEGVITPKAFEWRRRVGANKEGTFLEVTDIGDAVLIENSNLDQPTSTSQLRVTENTPEVYEYRCRVSLTELNIMRGISSRFQIEVTGPSLPQFNALEAVVLSYDSAIVQWTVLVIAYTPETYMVNYGTDANSLVEKSQPQASGDDFSALNLMFQVQVTGLSYSTVYYYQLVANNSFGHTSSPVMSFITPDLFPGPVTMVTWTPLSGGVVRVEWKEPAVTNGVILYYVVNLTRCWHDESEIESRHVNNSATYAVVFNSGQLSPGVPYCVSVVAVNSAGGGNPFTITNFTEILPAPAPSGITADRSNDGMKMVVAWTRLTLAEARGFVQYYIITISGGSSNQQKRQTALRRECDAKDSPCLAPESNSSITVTNLEPSSNYTVTVAAANGFQGPPSEPPLAIGEGDVIVGEHSEPLTIDAEESPLGSKCSTLFDCGKRSVKYRHNALASSDGEPGEDMEFVWIMIGTAAAATVLMSIVIVVALLVVVLVMRRRQQAKKKMTHSISYSYEQPTAISVTKVDTDSDGYQSTDEVLKDVRQHQYSQLSEKQPCDYEIPVPSLRSSDFQPLSEEGTIEHDYAIPIVRLDLHGAEQQEGIGRASSPIYINQETIPVADNPAYRPSLGGPMQSSAQPDPDPELLGTSVLFYASASL